MFFYLSNPFTDPNDPWYYVIGVIFLLLIFGALALYVVLSNKKKKDGRADAETTEQPAEKENAEAVSDEQQVEGAQTEDEPQKESSDAEENKTEE